MKENVSKKKFSVVIPVYNRKNLVTDAIDSVLSQKLTSYEIIVVDDGSTDGTQKAVEEYSKNIKIISQENSGPAVARNRGIAMAEGEYITFLDSDDLWFPWTLSTFQRAIEEYNCPSLIVGTDIVTKLGEGVTAKRGPYKSKAWKNYYTATLEGSGQAEAPSIRKTAVDAETLRKVGGFTTKDINFEDADLWMKLGVAQGFVHVKSPPAAAYRRHKGGISNDASRVYRGVRELVRSEEEGQYPGGKQYYLARTKIITIYTRSKSVELLNNNEYRRAFEIYKKTLVMNLFNYRFKYTFLFPILLLCSIIKWSTKEIVINNNVTK